MKEMKVKAAKLCYQFLLIQHQALHLQVEKKYLSMINVILYQCIIREHFKEAFSQCTLVALVRAGVCEVNQAIFIKWARKSCHYVDNLARRAKHKVSELEKKMAKAQLPTSEAILKQVSEELDSQLPFKVGRQQSGQDKRDSKILVIPKSNCTEHKQSKQHSISPQHHEQEEIDEKPISGGQAILSNITIQIAQPSINPQSAVKSTVQDSTIRKSGDPFSVGKSGGNRRGSICGRNTNRGIFTSSSGQTDPFYINLVLLAFLRT